ncbi:MAG: phosphoglucosamine mutase [Bacteroidetes bacterium]|nr:phosphoglucosamine mutase [Bacteroidota bacterium]MCK5765334.1 phosphoglucosamine mutase [Bacteroidales bacterium]
MTLIKSISGIRGTIGGIPGRSLTPIDIVKFVSAFAGFIGEEEDAAKLKFIVGRDARVSGDMVNRLVCGTLMGMGVDVIDVGLSTTPTVEMKVVFENAHGGIILTASHNPGQWNALKLLNGKGEFISADDGARVLYLAEQNTTEFPGVGSLGVYSEDKNAIQQHIEAILALPMVDVELIRKRDFHVALDCVNSTGGIALPELLRTLGVSSITELYCEPSGHFPHNPEPLPENLTAIAEEVRSKGADIGFVVDPDVDRLAIVTENGDMFGEEYTLVAVADYILRNTPGNTVSNLSSTGALRDITDLAGGKYYASAVGEVNVVSLMKEVNAVIGGEGNGGVIYPELHYGRDALVGIALFLTFLAKEGVSCSALRAKYPDYHISKNKIELKPEIDVDAVLQAVEMAYPEEEVITIDGVKIIFDKEWVHLRKSNTEPIIRIYAESSSREAADKLAQEVINKMQTLL